MNIDISKIHPGWPITDRLGHGGFSHIYKAICTKWSAEYWNRVLSFLENTGSDFIEIDGPYHFYTCTGNKPGQTEHLHKGLADSRYPK